MKAYPGNPDVTSLNSIVSQRELSVKVDAAEEILWTARRHYRRDPAEAVATLAKIDVQGLPEPLARQVFGEWARACARLCREREIAEPLRYAPDPGRGAIIARETPDGAYVVISALSMGPAWETGRRLTIGRSAALIPSASTGSCGYPPPGATAPPGAFPWYRATKRRGEACFRNTRHQWNR